MRISLYRTRVDLPSVGEVCDALLDLLFPLRCVVCGQWAAHLCESCLAEFPRIKTDHGPRDWVSQPASISAATPTTDPRSDRRAQTPAFRSWRAAFIYTGGVRDVILALKYEGRTAVVGPLIAAIDVSAIPDDVDCLVPVPMHGRRRRVRGFNQTDLITQHLAARLGRPVARSALHRTRATAPQTRQPDWEARWVNVADAFAARPQHVGGRRILLVDDVTTSGATFDFCARALLEAGAESVDAWAVAHGG